MNTCDSDCWQAWDILRKQEKKCSRIRCSPASWGRIGSLSLSLSLLSHKHFVFSHTRSDHPSSVRNLVMVMHDHLHWGGSDGMLLSLQSNIVGWRKVSLHVMAIAHRHHQNFLTQNIMFVVLWPVPARRNLLGLLRGQPRAKRGVQPGHGRNQCLERIGNHPGLRLLLVQYHCGRWRRYIYIYIYIYIWMNVHLQASPIS